MIDRRPHSLLGVTKLDWLDARHHFNFAGYHSDGREGWGCLSAFNHNLLAPHAAMSPYPIDNIDILTIARRGVLGHAGTFGERHRALPGDVQLISAGSGIEHGDINLSHRPAEYFEIRLRAQPLGGTPSRSVTVFPNRKRAGELIVLASDLPDDRHSLRRRASARVLGAKLPTGRTINYPLQPSRHLYVVAASGVIEVNGSVAEAHCGLAISGESLLEIKARKAAEIILVDSK